MPFNHYCRIDLEQRDLITKLAQIYMIYYIHSVPKYAMMNSGHYKQLLSNIWQSYLNCNRELGAGRLEYEKDLHVLEYLLLEAYVIIVHNFPSLCLQSAGNHYQHCRQHWSPGKVLLHADRVAQ